MSLCELPKLISLDKKKKKEFWDPLIKNELSPFKDKEYWYPFVYALAIGYNKCRPEKLSVKEGTIPGKTIEEKKEIFGFFKAIALIEGGISVLTDGKEVARIVEEYANAGVVLLYKSVFESGNADAIKILEADTIELLENTNKKK